MTALSAAREKAVERESAWGQILEIPMKGSTTIYQGGGVMLDGGYATPGAVAAGKLHVGRAMETKTNSGSSGAKTIKVKTGIFLYDPKSGDAPTAANLFGPAYWEDDQTVRATIGSSSAAGLIVDVTTDGIWVAQGYLVDPNDSIGASLLSVADGAGASLVGIEDDGSFTAQVNVEEALQEIYQHLLTGKANIPISLTDLREVDTSGDVSNIAANGGLLASDTTPIFRGDSAESWELAWAASNSDIVAFQTSLPDDFDGTGDVKIELDVFSAGTPTDPASFSCLSSWDGGAQVTDSVDDTATKSNAVHTLTITIAAADIPNAARRVTVELVPGAHTTDVISLVNVRFLYKRKLLTA
jgi:hypothetical protein